MVEPGSAGHKMIRISKLEEPTYYQEMTITGTFSSLNIVNHTG
jgi:hypothetical protein